MKFRTSILIVVTLLCSQLAAADNSYVLGRISNGTYTNHQLGVRAYFSENWKILSREEIATLYGLNPSASSTLEMFRNGKTPFFYAMSTDGLAHVTIALSNLGVMVGNAITPKESKKALEEAAQALTEIFTKSFSEMGFTGTKAKRISVSLAGRKYTGFSITGKMQGVDVYQKAAICHKGEYIYCVSAMSFTHDITDKLLAMFKSTGGR